MGIYYKIRFIFTNFVQMLLYTPYKTIRLKAETVNNIVKTY